MPPPVPEKFTNADEQTLWRDIARLQEDYIGDHASFGRVIGDILSTLNGADKTASEQAEARVNGHREAITHELESNPDLVARYTDAILCFLISELETPDQ